MLDPIIYKHKNIIRICCTTYTHRDLGPEMLKEYEPVADIIDRTLIDLYDAGRWSTLAGWIDALPEDILKDRPQ